MKVSIFGAGYVGLSIGLFISQEHSVTIFDIDREKIDKINNRICPLEEDLMKRFMQNSELTIKAELFNQKKLDSCDLAVICLPTNFDTAQNSFDTSVIEEVVSKIAEAKPSLPIVIKSTVPIGFTDRLKLKFNLNECFFSPEFLREGQALYDTFNPSRIIIGSTSNSAKVFGNTISRLTKRSEIDVKYTDNSTAEAIKLFSNAYLANRVAFFNEMDSFALKAGLDEKNLVDGVSADPRIGVGYNNPSFGYGGYCLPKDVAQLSEEFTVRSIKAPLITNINISNTNRLSIIANEIAALDHRKVGIYRLQMKSGSDNLRESASIKLVSKLFSIGLKPTIFEPNLEVPKIYAKYHTVDFEKFANNCDIIVANRWDEKINKYKHKLFCRDISNVD